MRSTPYIEIVHAAVYEEFTWRHVIHRLDQTTGLIQ
jgi:hypothetical protein